MPYHFITTQIIAHNDCLYISIYRVLGEFSQELRYISYPLGLMALPNKSNISCLIEVKLEAGTGKVKGCRKWKRVGLLVE